MKFCDDHWAALRAEIDRRGLAAMVSDGGAEAAEKLARSANSEPTFETFDPLMGANMAILGVVLGRVGPSLLFPNEDGTPKCPLCYIKAVHEEACDDPDCTADYDAWIVNAVDDQVAIFRGLV